MGTDLSVINNVRIYEDNNVIHFEPTYDIKEKSAKNDNRNWFQKLVNWFTNSSVKPYVKIRNLADPFNDRTDADTGCDGKSGIETGIKITF